MIFVCSKCLVSGKSQLAHTDAVATDPPPKWPVLCRVGR